MSVPPNPPRRIAPQPGAAAWTGADLPASEYMLPLGAEHGTELAGGADAPTPKLDALAAEIGTRLDHGRGVVLLRGLPAAANPAALLQRLGRRLGTPLPGAGPGAPLADVLLMAAFAPAEMVLLSAAAVHNALLSNDRVVLAALYEAAPSGRAPVFAVIDGVFAGLADPVLLAGAGTLPAFAGVLAEPALPLRVSLRPGDVLALNPLLVWLWPAPTGSPTADPLAGAAWLALRTAQSRAEAWTTAVGAGA